MEANLLQCSKITRLTSEISYCLYYFSNLFCLQPIWCWGYTYVAGGCVKMFWILTVSYYYGQQRLSDDNCNIFNYIFFTSISSSIIKYIKHHLFVRQCIYNFFENYARKSLRKPIINNCARRIKSINCYKKKKYITTKLNKSLKHNVMFMFNSRWCCTCKKKMLCS